MARRDRDDPTERRLREISETLERSTRDLKDLIREMRDTVKEADKNQDDVE